MVAGRGRLPAAALRARQLGGSPSLATFTGRLGGVPAVPKISAQDELTILARHDAGEPLRVIAADYPLSHQALSKRLRRARARLGQERERQPELAGEPAGERGRAPGPRRRVGPSAAAAVAAVSPSRGGFADGLVRLRRGKEACWVDPLAESTVGVEGDGLASLMAAHAAGLRAPGRVAACLASTFAGCV